METYEYHQIQLETNVDMSYILNDYGKKGWTIAHLVPIYNSGIIIKWQYVFEKKSVK